MKRLHFVFVLLLVLAIGIPVSQVLAVDCSATEDCYILIDESHGGWDLFSAASTLRSGPTNNVAGYSPEFNLEDRDPPRWYYNTGSSYGTVLAIKRVLPEPCVLDGYYIASAGGYDNYFALFIRRGETWTNLVDYYSYAELGSVESEFGGVIGGDPVDEIQIQSSSVGGTQVRAIHIEASDCDGGGGPGTGLTFPLSGVDAHEQWGTYDLQYVQDNDLSIPEDVEISEFPNTVYSFSSDPEAKVHAVADGTVISVTPYTGLDCSGAFVVLQSLRRCRVIIPEFITQETGSFVFGIELINISLVVVQDAEDDDITYTYWLADAVVGVGDDIVAGCILGKTIQLKNPTNFEITGFDLGFSGSLSASGDAGVSINGGISAEFRSLLVEAGVTTVVAKVEGEPVPLYPLLTEEPDSSNCATSSLTNCIVDNPDLKPDRNGMVVGDWSTSGATAIDGGGVHIQNGGSIVQFNIAILPDVSYTLSVLARVTTPIDSFYPIRLEVGSASTTVNITEGDYQLKTWALGPREVSTLHHIGVFNQTDFTFNSEFPVEVDIKYICFAPVTANVAPGACYFANHQFTADGQGWVTSGNVQFIPGQAVLGDAAVIEQSIPPLLPHTDGPATYTVSALVRLSATNQFTGQVGKELQLVYSFPETESYAELGLIDSVLVESEGRNTYDGTVNVEHVYNFSQEFEISVATDGLSSFGVLITDTDNYIRGLRIDQLCITPDTPDGSFPGQDGGGGFTPPFIERCGVIPTPTDNNISSWTYFHWKNLERFFDCTLMIQINKMAATIDTAWKTVRLFLRWCVVLVNRVGDWFTSFVWWLGGHFRNIAVGRVTTVYESGGGTCSDFFCVLDSLINGILTPVNNIVNTLLGILTTTVNLVLTILTGVIGLGLAFLGRLITLFGEVTGLFTGLIGAYSNATPATIEGLPMCGIDPSSSPFCRATHTLDNTIFAGRWAVLFVLMIGVFSIHLIIWVIGEFKQTILITGSSS